MSAVHVNEGVVTLISSMRQQQQQQQQ